jgi:hypothetical protein
MDMVKENGGGHEFLNAAKPPIAGDSSSEVLLHDQKQLDNESQNTNLSFRYLTVFEGESISNKLNSTVVSESSPIQVRKQVENKVHDATLSFRQLTVFDGKILSNNLNSNETLENSPVKGDNSNDGERISNKLNSTVVSESSPIQVRKQVENEVHDATLSFRQLTVFDGKILSNNLNSNEMLENSPVKGDNSNDASPSPYRVLTTYPDAMNGRNSLQEISRNGSNSSQKHLDEKDRGGECSLPQDAIANGHVPYRHLTVYPQDPAPKQNVTPPVGTPQGFQGQRQVETDGTLFRNLNTIMIGENSGGYANTSISTPMTSGRAVVEEIDVSSVVTNNENVVSSETTAFPQDEFGIGDANEASYVETDRRHVESTQPTLYEPGALEDTTSEFDILDFLDSYMIGPDDGIQLVVPEQGNSMEALFYPISV